MHSLFISLLDFNPLVLFLFAVLRSQVECLLIGLAIEKKIDRDQVSFFMEGCFEPEKNQAS
jgi:hypothetical protein